MNRACSTEAVRPAVPGRMTVRIIRPRASRSVSAGVLWRWRWELLLTVSASLAVADGIRVVGPFWTLTIALMAGYILADWPAGRKAMVASAWWLITPHRVRTGCAEAGIYSARGRIPFIISTSSEPRGERVRLWCPAGTCAEDFEAACALLRAACWAADVQVQRHPRHAHLVTLDVIRSTADLPELTI